MTQELSERAKLRLRLAAGLLRGSGHKFDMPRNEFYPVIQEYIKGLDKLESARLKDLTNWLEEYSKYDIENEPVVSTKRRA